MAETKPKPLPKSKPGVWSSERLIYRGMEEGDEDALLAWSRVPSDFMRVAFDVAVPQSKSMAKKGREFLQKTYMCAVICLKPDATTTVVPTESPKDVGSKDATSKSKETIVGMICLHGRFMSDVSVSQHRGGELGIHMSPEHQNKGYGGEAILWLLHWSFRIANLNRVQLGCFEYNPRAFHLYQKLGFVVEGRLRQALWHNGRYWDRHEMGMLRSEWEELYGKEYDTMEDDPPI